MNPNDDMEQLVRGLKHRARPEFRKAARDNMLAELDKVTITNHQPIWKAVMKSRSFRYATASSILATTLALVVILSGLTGGNHAVALAQVLAKTEAMSTLVLQERRAFYLKDAEEPFLQGHAIKYISSEIGQVEEYWTDGGKSIFTAYFLKKENRVLVLFPAAKGYLDLPLTDKLATLSDDVTPMGLVKLLTRHGYVKVDRTERDGHQVDGFEVTRESIQAVLAPFQEYPGSCCPVPSQGRNGASLGRREFLVARQHRGGNGNRTRLADRLSRRRRSLHCVRFSLGR